MTAKVIDYEALAKELLWQAVPISAFAAFAVWAGRPIFALRKAPGIYTHLFLTRSIFRRFPELEFSAKGTSMTESLTGVRFHASDLFKVIEKDSGKTIPKLDYFRGDELLRKKASYLQRIGNFNPHANMVHAQTEDSFIFFYSSHSKKFSDEAFQSMLLFLYKTTPADLAAMMTSQTIEECRKSLAALEPKEGKQLIVADIETNRHHCVVPKFVVVDMTPGKGVVASDDKSSPPPAPKLHKSAGFTATIDGKEQIFGMVLDLRMSSFEPSYTRSAKHCFMKELTKKGFSEQQVMAYMFRYLEKPVLYKCMSTGEIHLKHYVQFLFHLLKDSGSNVFIVCPDDHVNDGVIDESRGTVKVKRGQFILPGPTHYVMEIKDQRVKLMYASNFATQCEFSDTKFIDHIQENDPKYILHTFEKVDK